DDPVVVDGQLAVVVEVAVDPALRLERVVEVDFPIVVDGQLAVEVGVAAVGVLHDHGGGGDGFAVEGAGLGAGQVEGVGGGGDGERRQLAAGAGADDAAPIPRAAVAAGGDQAGDAGVGRAGPRAGVAAADDQVVVGQVELPAR